MRCRLAVQTDGRSLLAWAVDLPGCVFGASNQAELDELAPVVFAEHVTWLRRHGIPAPDVAGWDVVETVDSRQFDATGGEFCFEFERQPVTAGELTDFERRLEAARADLLAVAADLPDALLDWRPPLPADAHIDPWSPEPRSIREMVRHVLQLEVYYRDGLGDGTGRDIFERISDPAEERQRTLAALRAAVADGPAVYRVTRPGRDAPEEWSVRKVVRRILSHDRAHTAEIAQRLTWPLLGVPR